MVRRIGQSIGAPELGGTYKKLLEAEKGDAARLVVASVMLDCFQIPLDAEIAKTAKDVSASPTALWVLRQLVAEHLHIFQVDASEKQKLCAAAGIRYKSGLGTGQRPKLLPPGRK